MSFKKRAQRTLPHLATTIIDEDTGPKSCHRKLFPGTRLSRESMARRRPTRRRTRMALIPHESRLQCATIDASNADKMYTLIIFPHRARASEPQFSFFAPFGPPLRGLDTQLNGALLPADAFDMKKGVAKIWLAYSTASLWIYRPREEGARARRASARPTPR
jgi:hypothetical protein